MMGALSFTTPLILSALVTLPFIWLLLRATPPSPKRQKFPAFVILRQLQSVRETPDRTPWWLLLLRLFIAGLIIIGLAGPILNAPPVGEKSGPIIAVIDDTLVAAQHWSKRRDAMLEAAAEATQSDRPFFLITTAPKRESDAIEPLTGEAVRKIADRLEPQALYSDRNAARSRLAELEPYLNEPADIRWFSDGLAGPDDQALANRLKEFGDLSVFIDRAAPKFILRPAERIGDSLNYRVERLRASGPIDGALVAIARDGRELARAEFEMAEGERDRNVTINLPLALANDLSIVHIENISSAGAVQLTDARNRRALIGLVNGTDRASESLLSGAHYIRQSLSPYAAFIEGSLQNLLESDASVIILDDIGKLRTSETNALRDWIESGGVLIRFAGPVLAEAAQGESPELLPVALRGGGRAFGGALTWETPQKLDDFSDDSPFTGIAIPDDVLVRRQVLAEPGGETTNKTWARLMDGTPLVTGTRTGAGVIALFHVTATPDWSDLPISGLFVEMLRKLTFLSTIGPDAVNDQAEVRYPPLRLLDGQGRLMRPDDTAVPLTISQLSDTPSPIRAPGFYGAQESPLALNAIDMETGFSELKLDGVALKPYVSAPPRDLRPPFILVALLLFLLDGLAALRLSGALRMRASAMVIAIAFAAAFNLNDAAFAQPLDRPIAGRTADAALTTRLAFIETGDPQLDNLAEQGLAALSRELHRRTAIEPAPPVAINPDTDDLAVYSFLYWPISGDTPVPSDAALANIENFINFGGLLLIDTRDDERFVGAGTTPESQALQRILKSLNIPSLTPVTNQHVLTRSFYLLNGLTGRMNNNPVWVEADTSGSNDGVTGVIIGGRDWAGAWAADNFGRPMRPMTSGGPRGRELAYRAGVNMVMVAFTGNYKSDQVHTPILLERLGK
ncbi:DUF4159 domain-containing protein [Hyphococcus formosus]|uniref:DUF4159 domain-containing protein n=1 Tax=Hyphococcus formosus TaxID=3143534 RepID=UPI00398B6222